MIPLKETHALMSTIEQTTGRTVARFRCSNPILDKKEAADAAWAGCLLGNLFSIGGSQRPRSGSVAIGARLRVDLLFRGCGGKTLVIVGYYPEYDPGRDIGHDMGHGSPYRATCRGKESGYGRMTSAMSVHREL